MTDKPEALAAMSAPKDGVEPSPLPDGEMAGLIERLRREGFKLGHGVARVLINPDGPEAADRLTRLQEAANKCRNCTRLEADNAAKDALIERLVQRGLDCGAFDDHSHVEDALWKVVAEATNRDPDTGNKRAAIQSRG